ncbi:MAG: PilW family protein, partial [Acidiferrobacterales bacterium]
MSRLHNVAHNAPGRRHSARRPLSRKAMSGFTLVELMVAVTIGLIILAALSQLFVSSRATYQVEEGLSRVQESGRIAMEFLTRDLRMAGYAGCLNVNKTMDTQFNYQAVTNLAGGAAFETDFAT